MSNWSYDEPTCTERAESAICLSIEGRARDLGDGFSVRRMLPAPARRSVGPFVFFDQMGPAQMAPGHGLDVRPHPHIDLATVTYLFEGEILHRDSLGTEQPIRPGAVNWMTAGRGIVHSERSPASARRTGARLHGLQLWVALPTAAEQQAPSFRHYPADVIPAVERDGSRLRIIAGTSYGETSPVAVHSPLFYVEARLERRASLTLPDEHRERALHLVTGVLVCEGRRHEPGTMLILRPGAEVVVTAEASAHFVILGGEPLDGERHIWWNFVSSSRERIERAKDDWRNGRFPTVPGDETEFIPLPDR